jgi:hypothetical protein
MSRSLPVFGVLLAVAGCNAEQPGNVAEVAKHVGTYRAVGEGGDGALLEGTVRIVEGCFLVQQDTGGRYLPFFPEGEVRWSNGGLNYNGEDYGDGDAIALGGGASGKLEPLPANCGAQTGLSRWTVAQAS